ncbi:MAG: Ribonuclease Z, partial [uncultured Solirubrobacterales bacterium]
GSRRPLRRHRRLGPERAAGAAGDAREPRWRPPAVRLRRGHAASAPALDGTGRARGDLHHPLPRRPCPRPPRHAQDLRSARTRAAAERLRTGGARESVQEPAADARTPTVRTAARGARAQRRNRARGLPDRRLRGRPRRASTRVRRRRGRATGPFRRAARPGARRGARTRLRSAATRRDGTRRGRRSTFRSGRRPAATGAEGRPQRRHRSLRGRRRRGLGRRPSGPRGDLHRGRGAARSRDAPLDRARRRRARIPLRGHAARPHPRIAALRRPRAARGGADGVRADDRPAGLRSGGDPVSRAWIAGARSWGRGL